MQKIVPNLWYDKQAIEAARFYSSLFENSELKDVTVIEGTPSGDTDIVSFTLEGQEFIAFNGGPIFAFNPSISLTVACHTVEEIDSKWHALSEGGSVLMPLAEYPFSRRYGWTQDRYGLSWQLMLVDEAPGGPKITPSLLFSGDACGRAEEALHYYAEVFPEAEIGIVSHYGSGEAQSSKSNINYASFKLFGQAFSAMDHGFDADFTFNEAFSLLINCRNQQEIDYYWDRLSAVPEAEQCGWVKDKFGVSWQIAPENIDEFFRSGTKEELRRFTDTFLEMKKIDIAALEKIRPGR